MRCPRRHEMSGWTLSTGALRAIQDDVSGFSVHEETDKARTLRTKLGPLGCRAGIVLARGRFRCVSLLQRQSLLIARRITFPDSRAVRALSAVTVLCPFLHGRNYQNPMPS